MTTPIRTLFETQFLGPVGMIKAALPGMRARRGGAIVDISTIGVHRRVWKTYGEPGRLKQVG